MQRENDENMLVANFVTPSYRWDIEKLQQFLCMENVEEIAHLPISCSALDTWIWHYDKHGKYRVKSGYKLSMLLKQ